MEKDIFRKVGKFPLNIASMLTFSIQNGSTIFEILSWTTKKYQFWQSSIPNIKNMSP